MSGWNLANRRRGPPEDSPVPALVRTRGEGTSSARGWQSPRGEGLFLHRPLFWPQAERGPSSPAPVPGPRSCSGLRSSFYKGQTPVPEGQPHLCMTPALEGRPGLF